MSGAVMSKTEAKWKTLLAGVEAVLPARSSLMVNGKSTTQAQMVATLEAQIALFDAAATAKAASTAAVSALHNGMPAGDAFVKQLITAIKTFLGDTSPELAQFGIPRPKVRAAQSAGKKAIAQVRRTNTRQARVVMGKNQRAAIQPNVVPTTVTLGADGKPLKTPAATPAPEAAPAPATPAAPVGAPSGAGKP